MKKVVFFNHRGSHCGIHQYGKRVFEVIKKIPHYEFFYQECSGPDEVLFHYEKKKPEFAIYNYSPNTMPYLDGNLLDTMPLSTAVYLAHRFSKGEVASLLSSPSRYIIFGNPQLKTSNARVFSIGRIIPEYENRTAPPKTLTFGSVGFGGRIKGFSTLIDLIQATFSHAQIRINIPPQQVSDPTGSYARDFYEREKQRLKNPNIELVVSNHFFTKNQLLDFLGNNSINVLFYDPEYSLAVDEGGISSLADEALAVGRPLAVTSSHLFRHLFSASPSILLDFDSKESTGFRLKQIIENGTEPLKPFMEKWTEENFRTRFSTILQKIDEDTEPFRMQPALYNHVLPTSIQQENKKPMEALSTHFSKNQKSLSSSLVHLGFLLTIVKHCATPLSKILYIGSPEDLIPKTLLGQGYPIEILPGSLEEFCQSPHTKLESYECIVSLSGLGHLEEEELYLGYIESLLKPGGKAVFTLPMRKAEDTGDPVPSGISHLYTKTDLEKRLIPFLKKSELIGEKKWDDEAFESGYYGIEYSWGTLTFQKRIK